MFDSQQKSTGTGYTTTVALLAVAFVFIPAVLVISHPFSHFVLLLAIACSAICVIWAWINWKKSSRLTIPSIEVGAGKAK